MRRRNIPTNALLICGSLFFAFWPARAAELDPAALRKAAAYSASHHGLSFLVRQNGRTLLEEYPGKGDAETAWRIYSGTKAFWNLAALAAADDGLLDLDEPVARTIASWRKDPRKARVTIRQLLDFSAGLAPGFGLQQNDYGDRDRTALRLPLVAEPGRAFIYGPSALQVFHQILKEKLGEKTPTEYLERRVLRRLHLGPAALPRRPRGQSPARRRLHPQRAAVGENRRARARQRQARRATGNARANLARLAREPRLLVRLVEQPRRAAAAANSISRRC